MNNLLGIIFFVLSSVFAGALLGGLFGFLSTAINNFILLPYFGAALGTYRWWIEFHIKAWAICGGLISLIWGLFLAFQRNSGPGQMG